MSLVIQTLEKVGTLLIQEMASDLMRKKKVASKGLIDSLKMNVDKTTDGYEVNITGKDYAKWVNIGRKKGGKKVPISALLPWIRLKGFETGNNSLVSLAFAIQTAIWKNGIAPTNFIEDSMKKANKTIESKVLEAMGYEVSANIDNLIKKHWNSKDGTN